MPFRLSIVAQSVRLNGVLAVWAFINLFQPTSALAQDPALALENTLIKVIEQSEPSVVSIARIRKPTGDTPSPSLVILNDVRFQNPPPEPENPENPDFQPNSYGAGLIVTPPHSNDRYVLTNYHVVQGGPIYPNETAQDNTQLFIRLADRRTCLASISAADPRSDLAVLRLHLERAEIGENELKPMDWSMSSPARKGQFVVMLGNPYALAHDGSASASCGMVSNLARRPLPVTDDRGSKVSMYRLGNLIQIDGRLNLGTSGGPLLNLKGELIGLTTSLAAVEGYEKSAGFAIPIDDLTRRIVKSLLAGQEVEYGMLGIYPEDITPSNFRELKTGLKQASAAKVKMLTRDSPADRAGIHPNDVLLSVADIPIYSEHDLMRIVGLHPPESVVDVVVWRRGLPKPFSVKVMLGKWPVHEDERIIETSPRFSAWRGMSVDYPTGRQKWMEREPAYRRAVVITKVAPDSAAHAAGLQPGMFISDVQRTAVQTPSEFHEAVKSLRGPVELRLYEGAKVVIGE